MQHYTKDVYVTDALKITVENLANAFGGSYITQRYADLLEPQQEESAEQIKERIVGKLNGRI